MKRSLSVLLGLALTWAPITQAQEQGNWRALSKTASSITGDISLHAEKLSILFLNFPMAQIRVLKPAEAAAPFSSDGTAPAGTGSLYRLSIAADQKFVRKNTLCGAEETQWMVTYVQGRNLQIAFFSGAKMPELTSEAIANTTELCGTYSYVR